MLFEWKLLQSKVCELNVDHHERNCTCLVSEHPARRGASNPLNSQGCHTSSVEHSSKLCSKDPLPPNTPLICVLCSGPATWQHSAVWESGCLETREWRVPARQAIPVKRDRRGNLRGGVPACPSSRWQQRQQQQHQQHNGNCRSLPRDEDRAQ